MQRALWVVPDIVPPLLCCINLVPPAVGMDINLKKTQKTKKQITVKIKSISHIY